MSTEMFMIPTDLYSGISHKHLLCINSANSSQVHIERSVADNVQLIIVRDCISKRSQVSIPRTGCAFFLSCEEFDGACLCKFQGVTMLSTQTKEGACKACRTYSKKLTFLCSINFLTKTLNQLLVWAWLLLYALWTFWPLWPIISVHYWV